MEALVSAGYRHSIDAWSGSRVQMQLAAWIALHDALIERFPAEAKTLEAGAGILTCSRFRRLLLAVLRRQLYPIREAVFSLRHPASPQ